MRAALFGLMALLAACATSPLGRQQLAFVPDEQMATMGAQAFDQVRAEKEEVSGTAQSRLVQCVAGAVTDALEEGPADWDVTLFRDDAANAFALPGGKIGVFTGLLDVAKSPDQLAAVIAHEVAHVIAKHPNERVSTNYAAQVGLDLLEAFGDLGQRPALMSLLGIGTQVGVLLPFNRKQESEADLYGLDLMARAGFDPRAAAEFWRNMEQTGGNGPPEFLSTHPSGSSRIRDLKGRIPDALPLYEKARAAGRRPDCG
jgi:predicted Zn-dependent protease